MEKKVGSFEARRQFGKMLQEVMARGERFVVERHGAPVAVLVPIEVYEQWKRARNEFFARLRAASNRANLPLQEAEQLADEAVLASRAEE